MQNDSTPKPPVPQSTVAPSEKHLEDWIVANPNAFGDLFDNDDYSFLGYSPYQFDSDHVVLPYIDSIVGRQINLPTGRPDLIAYGNRCVSVVELKKGGVTYDVIGQCQRYKYDLKHIFSYVFRDATKTREGKKAYYYQLTHDLYPSDIPSCEINGIVVGHSVQDRNIVIVAASCGIQVVTYQHLGGKYRFEQQVLENTGTADDYLQHISSPIGKAMRLMMHDRAKADRKQAEYIARLQS